ncbi:MAG: carboxypeptidase-like regulatory domain-containing protein [Christensenellaceae bacterium]|jgi:hypothetical protein|nr:carboxypeptidase-like regulatory domain-containing protein [Christensenellaceae bacterium]
MHILRPKRLNWSILLLIFASLAAALVLYLVMRQGPREYGHLDVSVIDAYTLQPLAGAVLVVPESDQSARTDFDGRAQIFGVPILRTLAQSKLLPESYGTCTLLVYHEGYVPYALMFLRVPAGQMRNGPTIHMFPEGEGDGLRATTVVESPDYDWVCKLVEKYRQ